MLIILYHCILILLKIQVNTLMILRFTKCTLLMLLISITTVRAQTIIQSANLPDVGSVWSSKTLYDNSVQPGPGGQGQVWNFLTFFINPSVLSESYIAPAGTSNDLLFPAANLKVTSFFGTDDYYYKTSSALQYLGSKNNAIEIIISNTQNLLTVPLEFGDSVTNLAVTGTGMQGYPIEGTVSVVADGSGDLILASAAFTNTLRVVTDINLVIGPGSGVDTYLRMTRYSWYTSTYNAPVFQISIIDLDGALGSTHQRYGTVSTLTSDISNPKPSALNFNINPNPAKNKTTLSFNLDHSMDVKLNISDVTGRIWKEENSRMLSGLNNIVLDLSTLPKGIYILSAVYGKSSRQQRLVVD